MKLTNADYIDWLADAEGNVRTAKAAYDRAEEQLASVKRRIAVIRADDMPPNVPYKREPQQMTLVITAKTFRYQHINAVKAVRECTWLGLKEAKDLMESELPIRIKIEANHNPRYGFDEVCRNAYKLLDYAGCVLAWE